jgi:hypothetical protein
VAQNQKIFPAQFREADGTSISITKFYLENLGRQDLHNRPNLPASEMKRRLGFKQRDNVKELCGSGLLEAY